ncbi:MAG: bifunctional phosphopantothenoylcysteine decarboxylase/phosphopantothenate synthase, partial [Alphaproteobacteria bacterium]|nr:bifunctional phosphopantothenoylcysteine decarboxylase/phosphopantothenate synthase [Alphaproteobacteria bacterium]
KLAEHAKAKLSRKGCDWIVANDVSVSEDGQSVMGGDDNTVLLVTASDMEQWDKAPKDEVARRLAQKIEQFFT